MHTMVVNHHVQNIQVLQTHYHLNHPFFFLNTLLILLLVIINHLCILQM